ncbi:CotH kinase family protein [Bacteroidota bacterium]
MKKIKYQIIALSLIIFINVNTKGQNNIEITEFMALNDTTLQDEDGAFSDWIEIHNSDTAEISLNGWYLTDNENDYIKWAFPNIILNADEYLIVFASGKDKKLNKEKLHTNFKLSSSGEFLALVKPGGKQYATAFSPAYPEQFKDISYGKLGMDTIYFSDPTPKAENDSSTFISTPDFSVNHGYYYNSFDLKLSCVIDDADIYYTNDASTPSKSNGIKYNSEININTTTVIRAITIKEGSVSSQVKTQSYIFPEDVIHQSNDQPGYPETWIDPRNGTDIDGNYSMKSEYVDNPDVNEVIIQSLESLPVISIVSDIDNFFSKNTHPDSGGIYMYNGEPDGPTRNLTYHLGRGWIRPGSVEYFNSDPDDGLIDFQANCGLKIHGGASRTRSKTEKHSFKIGFKPEYGPTKLKQKLFGKGSPDQYDWLILRGGFAPRLGLQVLDPWAKSALEDMGQYAARNKFVHVYLNGLYWGMYNLSEQMDENCMRDNLGGRADDYDIIKDYYEIEAGDSIAWDKLVAMADDNIENTENYQKLLGINPDDSTDTTYDKLLNAENFIDYIMMNMYAGTADWDQHNWFGVRRKTNSEGFHFLVWDAEKIFSNNNIVNWLVDEGNENRPSGLFTDLIKNEQFKNLFISHVNKHFFEGGALTPEPCLNRYEKWLNEIDTALIADQSRWIMNENDIWNKNYHSFIYDYFPPRTENVFKQFIGKELYPLVEIPQFNTSDKTLSKEFLLYMTAPEGCEIYYTLDGTDPGHFKMSENNSIIKYDFNPIPIYYLQGDELYISARVKKDSLWSIKVTKQFMIEEDSTVIINEISQYDDYLYNYPNPMNDYTELIFSLSNTSNVSLKIYNILGEQITTLTEGMKLAGEHKVNWNSSNLSSGIYICILENKSDSKRYRRIIIKE